MCTYNLVYTSIHFCLISCLVKLWITNGPNMVISSTIICDTSRWSKSVSTYIILYRKPKPLILWIETLTPPNPCLYPQKWESSTKLVALGFFIVAPMCSSLLASFHLQIKIEFKSSVSIEYKHLMLTPMIGKLPRYAYTLSNTIWYQMENKWIFLKLGRDAQVPVSPFLDTPVIVVKYKNKEIGVEIRFFKYITNGGDWSIQHRMRNSDWVYSLLPQPYSLSTFRVTSGTLWWGGLLEFYWWLACEVARSQVTGGYR